MASSLPSCSFYCRSASAPTVHNFANRFSLSSSTSTLGGWSRLSVRRDWRAFEARAKFEKFQGEEVGDDVEVGVLNSPESQEEGAILEGDDEDDRFGSVIMKETLQITVVGITWIYVELGFEGT